MTEAELAIVRRAYAKQMMPHNLAHPRVEAAFAAVPREAFLGPGPWPIVYRHRRGYIQTPYVQTPSDDPVYLYQDLLVGIIRERDLNNGQPSLHAKLIAAAAPRPGEHVVHIGAGVGYYTAILAHMVGESGRVTAIEFDGGLAERLAANFAGQPNVRALQGDGAQIEFDPADVIYVNAGATRPADIWLDRLNDGGRLILPLTSDKGFGENSKTYRSSGAARYSASSASATSSSRNGFRRSRSFRVKARATPSQSGRWRRHSTRAAGSR